MSEQLNGGEVAAENTNLTSEPHVGEKLRLAREALGMSATDMAHALKLGQRQLEALEAGNWQGYLCAWFRPQLRPARQYGPCAADGSAG